MSVRPVVIWPDPRLREPTRKVEKVDDAVRALYQDLTDTMYAENGLGIAAIQIGDATAMFLVDPKLAGRPETDPPVAFINPEILWASDETEETEEGCLSLAGTRPTTRYRTIKVSYQDLAMKPRVKTFTGFTAQIIQHEIDHCNGVLI